MNRRHLMLVLALAIPVGTRAQDVMPDAGDPRAGLAAGAKNTAAQSAQYMRLVSHSEKAPALDSIRGLAFVNSDLAFRGNYVYQGNFSGFMIWDVSDPARPALMSHVLCATDQGDPSIVGNLLFISAEANRSRNDCGTQGVEDPRDRTRGVRIFDVGNPRNPRLVKNVQVCRGSHTHTIVPHPTDPEVVYIYVGGSGGLRPFEEMAECGDPELVANPARVDIIRVPLNAPEQATTIGYARIFEGLVAAGARGPRGCHDLTSYPALDLVAGSCGSFGLLLDTRNPEQPVRLDAVADSNFSLWHTAVFGNDGTKVVFTDEWGGGTAPRCRITDPMRLGGNTILSIENGRMTQHAYFKMMAPQTDTENCVSHNGGLVPVPGRDIMVQGWYQGGVDVFDFTDPDRPFEIAHFDRGPVSDSTLVVGGSWGAYWYNGYIYSSELNRGLDVLELLPGPFLSQNEIDAAKLVRLEEYNPQSQPRIVWPAAFPVARSYLDQLGRTGGLPEARLATIAAALNSAERSSGTARRDALNRLAGELDRDATGSAAGSMDAARIRSLAETVRGIANSPGD